jgi:hypothetical protein
MNAICAAHASEYRPAQAAEIASAPAHVDAAASDQADGGDAHRRE